jgi:GT2 family glycosyltransferase
VNSRTTVVVATRDRRDALAQTLPHHTAPVILVDNGSRDGTPEFLARHFPHVEVICLDQNLGAPARNIGVQRARTEFVAFADDDSWWAAGALARAEEVFDAHPRLGLIAGSVLVGTEQRLDPTSQQMSDSVLGTEADLPGPSVLGFLACGAIVRKEAFLQAGGFDSVVFFFGEEERFALDLMAAGWALCYVADIQAHHRPAGERDGRSRQRLQQRNAVLTALMRRPWPVVAATALQAMRSGNAGRRGLLDAARRAAMALRMRRSLPAAVERARRRLDVG